MVGTSGDWRHQAWLALLVVAISAFSFVYACAPPFAAFSVLAAMTLSRRDAIRTTVALWLVNQVVGYVVLGYPRTVNSFSWGLIMGVAAVMATLLAGQIVGRLRTVGGLTRALVALGGTFAAYEVVLYAIAVAGLGGTGSFALSIVSRILVLNVIALAGLYALYRVGAAVGISSRPAMRETPAPVRIGSR
jgi:hypothetical protein